MGGSAFIPRFRNLKKDEKRDFIKGYCVIINSGGSAAPSLFAEYGEALQKKVDHYAGSASPAAFSASVRRVTRTMCGSTRTCPTPGEFRRCISK
jgi:hypothetical protein